MSARPLERGQEHLPPVMVSHNVIKLAHGHKIEHQPNVA